MEKEKATPTHPSQQKNEVEQDSKSFTHKSSIQNESQKKNKAHINKSGLKKYLLTPILWLIPLLFCYFCVDFALFIQKIDAQTQPKNLIRADAIIVLTGGRNRVQEGLCLLEKSYGKRLFISGVHEKSDKNILAHITKYDKKLFECCVDLDVAAEDTVGNAQESAKWLKKNGYKTAYLVTSDYHMPRSLLEFTALMPKIHFIPYPVFSSSAHLPFSTQLYRRTRILTSEYLKFFREKIRYALFDPS